MTLSISYHNICILVLCALYVLSGCGTDTGGVSPVEPKDTGAMVQTPDLGMDLSQTDTNQQPADMAEASDILPISDTNPGQGNPDMVNDASEAQPDQATEDMDPEQDMDPDMVIQTDQCQVTICLTGATNQKSGSNDGFSAICDRSDIPNLIQDCDKGTCYNTFDSFPGQFPVVSIDKNVYPYFFDAIDTNNDDLVNNQDDDCEINILGFSWGGVNAIVLAQKFMDDSRVDPARAKIARVLVMDSYQPLAGNKMNVPLNVGKFRSFRHSVAPAQDCSDNPLIGGPFKGLAPKCDVRTDCVDYDYSLSPELGFSSSLGTYKGDQIGHCVVPYVAEEAVIAELLDEPFSGALPKTVLVEVP